MHRGIHVCFAAKGLNCGLLTFNVWFLWELKMCIFMESAIFLKNGGAIVSRILKQWKRKPEVCTCDNEVWLSWIWEAEGCSMSSARCLDPIQNMRWFISAMSDCHAQAEWHKVALHNFVAPWREKKLEHCTMPVRSLMFITWQMTYNDFFTAEDLESFSAAYLIAGALSHFGMTSRGAACKYKIIPKIQ